MRINHHIIAAYQISTACITIVYATLALFDSAGSRIMWYAGFAVLAGIASLISGLLLWCDRIAGYEWSAIIQALQIPRFSFAGLVYILTLGADLLVSLRGGNIAFGAHLEWRAGFAIGAHKQPFE